MQIILLSGGSGKHLWPLSNDTRSKQFLFLLPAPDGGKESMVQRVVRQLKETGLAEHITFATSLAQKDIITNQLGEEISIVLEPERRDTFPAIALASAYLSEQPQCKEDEVIVVLPCDTYADVSYYAAIRPMVEAVERGDADLALLGIRPTNADLNYGYVLPEAVTDAAPCRVCGFTAKPDAKNVQQLIAEGALWNGGVFAFRLGFMKQWIARYLKDTSYATLRSYYTELPQESFDREVVERTQRAVVMPYSGAWKDLGTWKTLTEEIQDPVLGNVRMDEASHGTHVLNELELPILCVGAPNLVVAASHDGILIADKAHCEEVKTYADQLARRPMYEERRWGEYKVIDTIEFPDGHKALTKQLVIRAGKNISYQVHHHRDEVWTFIDGEGLLVLDGVVQKVTRGDVINIRKGVRHAVKGLTDLRFIEVQAGDLLVEEDIERFGWEW